MNIIHRLIMTLSGCLWLLGLQAQTVKSISVSQDSAYTDHLSLKEDAKDMDLMVKFVFNEDSNTLAVTLISYRQLYVFWDNVHYKPFIKGRKIRPDQLPYVIAYEPKDKYRVTNRFRASIPKPREEFYFKRWIEYNGLQPAPQEYKMINDFITQTFDIQNKRSFVSVKLRDVFLLDKIEKKKKNIYEIPLGRDLNLEYQINIHRNPCFGLDDDITAAQNALDGITNSYTTFAQQFGPQNPHPSDMLKVFKDMRGTLLGQYIKKNSDAPCPQLKDLWDQYDTYVDSIAKVKCFVIQDEDVAVNAPEGVFSPDGLKVLLSKARQLDIIVSRWLMGTTTLERRDMLLHGEQIISEVNEQIGNRTGRTEEQRKAISTFRAAEQYFRKTCK